MKFLQTKRGTKLLTSGWWGAARKINYTGELLPLPLYLSTMLTPPIYCCCTGDWLVTFSWCLLCGFDSPIPYFQAIYFAILLLHR